MPPVVDPVQPPTHIRKKEKGDRQGAPGAEVCGRVAGAGDDGDGVEQSEWRMCLEPGRVEIGDQPDQDRQASPAVTMPRNQRTWLSLNRAD